MGPLDTQYISHEPLSNGHAPSSKKDKKRKDKKVQKSGLQLQHIEPLTENQKLIFQNFETDKNLFICGSAGTGKTFLSLYLALKETQQTDSLFNKIIIVRSSVSVREIGYLPGGHDDKLEVFEDPYISNCNEIFGRSDAYSILKQKKFIEFMSTSFLRGLTLNDCIIIVDEAQNLSFHEADSIITRLGENAKIVFCGDIKQSDLRGTAKQGYLQFKSIIKAMPKYFDVVEMTAEDIVRSAFVKEYIMIRDTMGYE